MWDKLWLDVNLATMREGGAPYGAIEKAALAVKDGRIAWLGPMAELKDDAKEKVACGGRWMTPGLVDCHTHIVFGGQRWKEFALRLEGATYEEIARAGGGIVSTVEATRAAGEDELFASAAGRLRSYIAEGVTTVEIKSGYGLQTESELKMLRVARRLGRELPVDVRATFLGAHALPREFAGRQGAYIDLVCNEMIPRVAAEKLADAVDAFCEGIAFTPEETVRVFESAKAHGLRVKLHADQLSDLGGAALAARHHALSADHLECTGEAGVRAMAEGGTVAVVLPGANYFLRETRQPPIALLRKHGVPVALASNCNPGSSPALSLLLMLSMACTLFRLTPEEALAGVTRNAAKALGLDDRGVLEVGKRADLALWEIDHPAELSYWIGGNPCREVFRGR
jgi:imidazolonepropionase